MRLERMSWKDCEEYFKDHDMVILTTEVPKIMESTIH